MLRGVQRLLLSHSRTLPPMQNISSPPTMEEAESMHQVLDANHDRVVTETDFENLAVRYLCGQSASNRYETRTTTTVTVSRYPSS